MRARAAWCRYITANDTGMTGAHQAGFYVPKSASKILFDEPCQKGENRDKMVKIRWQNDFETDSRMIYYGQGTRNEYRITRFGKNFPFITDENTGNLLVLAKHTDDEYSAFVLSSDEDIDGFFAYFNLSPTDTNRLIDTKEINKEQRIEELLQKFIDQHDSFPETRQMALGARICYNEANRLDANAYKTRPDEILLGWYETEYKLYKGLENKIYSDIIKAPFVDVESFVNTANEVLNRRKSRAGKSLEHHLSDIFIHNNLIFESQAVTEDNKKPDFLFPNAKCYHNLLFPADDLIVLGAKTSCKDRWRQVLTEANRVEYKYLFTFQGGISRNQLREMKNEKLKLVVPRANIKSFPKEFQSEICDLSGFINIVTIKQERLPRHFLIG